MRAAGTIQALVGQQQALNGLSVHDVGLDDFVDIVRGNAAVPNLIGINDDGRTVLALVEASGHVGAHAFLEAAEGKFLLEEELELSLAGGIAAAAGMASLALIAADEEMLFELGHESQCTGFCWGSVGRGHSGRVFKRPTHPTGTESRRRIPKSRQSTA